MVNGWGLGGDAELGIVTYETCFPTLTLYRSWKQTQGWLQDNFSPRLQALFYNYKQLPIQQSLTFDFLYSEYYIFFARLRLKMNFQTFCVFYSAINWNLQFIFWIFIGSKTTPVARIIIPGAEGFQKLFFGYEEIAIPLYSTSDCFVFFILIFLFLSLLSS